MMLSISFFALGLFRFSWRRSSFRTGYFSRQTPSACTRSPSFACIVSALAENISSFDPCLGLRDAISGGISVWSAR